MSKPGEGESGRSSGFRRNPKPGGGSTRRSSGANWRFVKRRSDGGSERRDGGSVHESIAASGGHCEKWIKPEMRDSTVVVFFYREDGFIGF